MPQAVAMFRPRAQRRCCLDCERRLPRPSGCSHSLFSMRARRLEEGWVDFALYTDRALPMGFHHLPLFEEGFAVLRREGHPRGLWTDVGTR